MKTPEEIKKGLECCIGDCNEYRCQECPYKEENEDCQDSGGVLSKDAIEYIEWLEKNLQYAVDAADVLGAEGAKFERERDAAVKDLTEGRDCYSCKHLGQRFAGPCVDCMSGHGYKKNNYEWRGVCLENTEVQEDD